MINHNCKSTCNGCNVPTQSVFLPDIQSAILNFGAWLGPQWKWTLQKISVFFRIAKYSNGS